MLFRKKTSCKYSHTWRTYTITQWIKCSEMLDYTHGKSVDNIIHASVFSERKSFANIFTVVVGEFLFLRTFRRIITNARGCIKSVSFKSMQFLFLINHIFDNIVINHILLRLRKQWHSVSRKNIDLSYIFSRYFEIAK